MRIDTKSRLTVTAMLDLALRCDQGPVRLSAIGARQRISLSYLEQIFAQLRRHGLVRSTRGPGGGYGLARDAADITLADVVRAVDDAAPPRPRAAKPPASDGAPDQRIVSDWCSGLEHTMTRFMASVSLHELAERQRRLGTLAQPAPVRAVVPEVAEPRRRLVVTAANSVFAAARRLTL